MPRTAEVPTCILLQALAEEAKCQFQRTMTPEVRAHWEKDLKDLHMIYEYDAHDEDGNTQKWRYEIWFQEEVRRRNTPAATRC